MKKFFLLVAILLVSLMVCCGASPDPERSIELNNKALELANQGNNSEARELYEEAIQLSPDNAVAHHNFAMLEMDEGNYQQAIRRFEKAITADEGLCFAYAGMSAVYLQRGSPRKALDVADLGLEKAQPEENHSSLCYYTLLGFKGTALFDLGDTFEAQSVLTAALFWEDFLGVSRYPTPRVHYYLARIYERKMIEYGSLSYREFAIEEYENVLRWWIDEDPQEWLDGAQGALRRLDPENHH